MDILTANQLRILRLLSRVPSFADSFYLTGGTALAAFYLRHRRSEDLDLFTADAKVLPGVVSAFETALRSEGIEPVVERRLPTFATLLVSFPGETVKMDFAQDTPARIEPPSMRPEVGLLVDSLRDIASNKLSALFDRGDAKDFVDVFFILKEVMPIEALLPLAGRKHIGLEPYWLARACFRARDLAALPPMLRPVDLGEIKGCFLDLAERLMKEAPAPDPKGPHRA